MQDEADLNNDDIERSSETNEQPKNAKVQKSKEANKAASKYSPDKTQTSMHSASSVPIEVSEKVAVKSTRKKIEQDIQLLK